MLSRIWHLTWCRRAAFLLGIPVAAALLFVLTWVGSNMLGRAPIPAPLRTSALLPPPASTSDNGFFCVSDEISRRKPAAAS